MSANTQPQGAVLPSPEAIKILNENAAASAARSRFALLATQQQRVGRDALRRDFAPRQATGSDLPGTRPVPQDSTQPQTPYPVQEITGLLSQLTGRTGTLPNPTSTFFGGVGGRGGSSSDSGSTGSPSGGSGGGSYGSGVYTVTGQGNPSGPPPTVVGPGGSTGQPSDPNMRINPDNGQYYDRLLPSGQWVATNIRVPGR